MEDFYSINSFFMYDSPFLLVLVSCVFIRPFFRSLAATPKKKELTSSVYEITHSVIFLFIIQLPLEKTCVCVCEVADDLTHASSLYF